jgi:hypothetical protein
VESGTNQCGINKRCFTIISFESNATLNGGNPLSVKNRAIKRQEIKELNHMKVKWTKDNLRLRITPGELEALEAGKPVLERLQFGDR